MKIIALVATTLSLIMIMGCASSAETAEKQPAAQSRNAGELNEGQIGLLPEADARVVSRQGGKQMTLLEVLRQTGKRAAIFQFGGANCLECTNHAKHFTEELRSNSGLRDVAHVLVITDRFGNFQESEYQTLYAAAANAQRVYDEGKIWDSFKDPDPEAQRAAVLALNLDKDGVKYWSQGNTYKILPAAERLADMANSR